MDLYQDYLHYSPGVKNGPVPEVIGFTETYMGKILKYSCVKLEGPGFDIWYEAALMPYFMSGVCFAKVIKAKFHIKLL